MVACVLAASDSPIVNDRPIVGILSLPNSFPMYESKGRSYFAGSYVDWVEAGGARVVPIVYTNTAEEIRDLVSSLNGVLWTGGGAALIYPNGTLTPFAAAAKLVLDLVIEANQNGEHMPLWATCMGFEMLNVLVAQDPSVLTAGFNSENYTIPLNFTAYGPTSRMTSNNKEVISILSTQPVTMNNHHSGVAPTAFYGNSKLTSTFNVVSTNVDRDGKEFVSTIEGKTLPIYSSQWHPEKVQFEWWAKEVINHDPASVKANSHFSFFFVNETRKNTRAFPSIDAMQSALIYNYSPVFTGPTVLDFQQCYFFE